MYVCALKQVFNTVSFWDRTTDGNKRNKQTERRKDRFVSRSRALRGNDQRCEQLKTRQWHYQQTVDNNIVWHINTYDLNKKAHRTIASVGCREHGLFCYYCWCWFVHLLVWMCLCGELVAICFIEILFITPICLYIQYTRDMVYTTAHSHISTERLSLYSPIGASQKTKEKNNKTTWSFFRLVN